MNYNLNTNNSKEPVKRSPYQSLKSLISNLVDEKNTLIKASITMVIAALLNLAGPYIIGLVVDDAIKLKNYKLLFNYSGVLLAMYIVSLIAGYLQTQLMGTVGQRMLYSLRNNLFEKLQELPLEFFNQNKTGDLISRINNDTEKINQFFSQSLMQFLRYILVMFGAIIFLLSINLKLGLAALSPAVVILIFTKFISPWIKKKNANSLKTLSNLSSEVQESLQNFKVIVAFNRQDYFRHKFEKVNKENYKASILAGLANQLLMPVYTLFSNLGQLIVLCYGIYLISIEEFTIGFLISFIAYVTSFYNPLRHLASIWANFQSAMAAWDRILKILQLENNMPVLTSKETIETNQLITFKNVSFGYVENKKVLENIDFTLQKGKTYAFVGPTGGGKTTAASLIARLFDPDSGEILLNGKNIKSFPPKERSTKIGFILQDPFLFSGSLKDNILYGNSELENYSTEELDKTLQNKGLSSLIQRFDKGLKTTVNNSGEGISLGQKQLIAFIRAVLRDPELLILDEATANIDTVTEQLLEDILKTLPKNTSLVIIAHRLNTIEAADEIFFINSGKMTKAGSLIDAVQLLKNEKKSS